MQEGRAATFCFLCSSFNQPLHLRAFFFGLTIYFGRRRELGGSDIYSGQETFGETLSFFPAENDLFT